MDLKGDNSIFGGDDLPVHNNAKIMAVVVCHNAAIPALLKSLLAIVAQVDKTLVIDNCSQNHEDIVAMIGDFELQDNVELLSQTSNTGLGAAHNKGIRSARKAGFSHVLLLDQDSTPLSGMVTTLLDALILKTSDAAGGNKPPVAAVGARYLNSDTGSESFFVRFGWLKFRRQYCQERDAQGCIAADFLISSGSLIPLDALDVIGEMDETLFIDHVDTEWFLRARDQGYAVYGVCDALMQHGLGETTHELNVGRQRSVPQHKPFRYYYIFRNSILLYRCGWVSSIWKWNDAQRLLMIALMFGVWKSPRAENLIMMLRGVWDGLRGIRGKRSFS